MGKKPCGKSGDQEWIEPILPTQQKNPSEAVPKDRPDASGAEASSAVTDPGTLRVSWQQ